MLLYSEVIIQEHLKLTSGIYQAEDGDKSSILWEILIIILVDLFQKFLTKNIAEIVTKVIFGGYLDGH